MRTIFLFSVNRSQEGPRSPCPREKSDSAALASESRRRRGCNPQLVAVCNQPKGLDGINPKDRAASRNYIRLRRLHTHYVRLHTNPSDWIKTKGSGIAASFCFWPARTDSNRWPSESESDALSSCATGRYECIIPYLMRNFNRILTII